MSPAMAPIIQVVSLPKKSRRYLVFSAFKTSLNVRFTTSKTA
jgi:hypothetical protein